MAGDEEKQKRPLPRRMRRTINRENSIPVSDLRGDASTDD
jgi:hypothetical protein